MSVDPCWSLVFCNESLRSYGKLCGHRKTCQLANFTLGRLGERSPLGWGNQWNFVAIFYQFLAVSGEGEWGAG